MNTIRKDPRGFFVYKYVYNGEPVYIGKTVNIIDRIHTHARFTGIDEKFRAYKDAEVYYYRCSSTVIMNALESLLIDALKPVLNISTKTDIPSDTTILPPISWEKFIESDFKVYAPKIVTSNSSIATPMVRIMPEYQLKRQMKANENRKKDCKRWMDIIDIIGDGAVRPYHIITFDKDIGVEMQEKISELWISFSSFDIPGRGGIMFIGTSGSDVFIINGKRYVIIEHCDNAVAMHEAYPVIESFFDGRIDYSQYREIGQYFKKFDGIPFDSIWKNEPIIKPLRSGFFIGKADKTLHKIIMDDVNGSHISVIDANDIVCFLENHRNDYYKIGTDSQIPRSIADEIAEFDSIIKSYHSRNAA